ncbi:hypothetical protein [Pseudalkalibacillus caeni]|uniref:Sporulation protein n=1 Tax=Exobacillus caeni TaxID=2574798 RepID=A0A5R9EZF0_9BACL|nr:hypothetical protein [Pseudalkalibacillus caeni]TLS36702.1 hypothetical protein FCL54_14400 [Pseudalkalibacillus caeni]
MKKGLMIAGIIPVLLAACSPLQSSGARDRNEIQNIYETNLNPNNYRNMNANKPTLSNDQAKIREAVNRIDGVRAGMVAIVGNIAYVNVKFTKDIKQEDRRDYLNEIEEKVYKEVPRYKIRARES